MNIHPSRALRLCTLYSVQYRASIWASDYAISTTTEFGKRKKFLKNLHLVQRAWIMWIGQGSRGIIFVVGASAVSYGGCYRVDQDDIGFCRRRYNHADGGCQWICHFCHGFYSDIPGFPLFLSCAATSAVAFSPLHTRLLPYDATPGPLLPALHLRPAHAFTPRPQVTTPSDSCPMIDASAGFVSFLIAFDTLVTLYPGHAGIFVTSVAAFLQNPGLDFRSWGHSLVHLLPRHNS